MSDDKEAYTQAIVDSFQVFKIFNEIDRVYFQKDKSVLQLMLNKNEDKSEDCLNDLLVCKQSLEKIQSRKDFPEDVLLKQYLDLFEKNIQVLTALITVLKEAKDKKEEISFIEYKMMIDSYRELKKQLDSRLEVRIGYGVEEGQRRGLFKE